MIDLVITNGQIVLPDQILKTSIAVNNGKIIAIGSNASRITSKRVLNAENNLVLPGGVDTHDHTLNKRGFAGTSRRPFFSRCPPKPFTRKPLRPRRNTKMDRIWSPLI
jgi:predicted amidohydrolase YtcJ